MFLAGGLKSISIRAIANSINHSVGTIYLYYQNKSALLVALRQDGLLKLSETFRTVSPTEDAIDSLKDICWAYIDFAIRNPQTYNLLFLPLTEENNSVYEPLHPATFILNTIQEKIASCAQQGYSRFEDDKKATIITMSLLHGLASLFSFSCLNAIRLDTEGDDLQQILNGFLDIITKKI